MAGGFNVPGSLNTNGELYIDLRDKMVHEFSKEDGSSSNIECLRDPILLALYFERVTFEIALGPYSHPIVSVPHFREMHGRILGTLMHASRGEAFERQQKFTHKYGRKVTDYLAAKQNKRGGTSGGGNNPGGGKGGGQQQQQEKGKGKGKGKDNGNDEKVRSIVAHNRGVGGGVVDHLLKKIGDEVDSSKKYWLCKTITCPHVTNDRLNIGAMHCQRNNCDFVHGFKTSEGSLMPQSVEAVDKFMADNKANLDGSTTFREFCGKVNGRLDRLFGGKGGKGGKGKGGKGKGKW